MTVLHSSKATTDAVVQLLTTAGERVMLDDTVPADAGWEGVPGQSMFVPYAAVDPLGGEQDGTIRRPFSDADSRYQVTVWGATRAQSLLVLDRVHLMMLTWTLTVPGRSVALVSVEDGPVVFREDTGQPPLWRALYRYRVLTTPG